MGKLRRPGNLTWVSQIHLTDPYPPHPPQSETGQSQQGIPFIYLFLRIYGTPPKKFLPQNWYASTIKDNIRHACFMFLVERVGMWQQDWHYLPICFYPLRNSLSNPLARREGMVRRFWTPFLETEVGFCLGFSTYWHVLRTFRDPKNTSPYGRFNIFWISSLLEAKEWNPKSGYSHLNFSSIPILNPKSFGKFFNFLSSI